MSFARQAHPDPNPSDLMISKTHTIRQFWLFALIPFIVIGAHGDVRATNTNAASATCTLVCPFCSSVARTFTDQLTSNEVAVVAKLVKLPDPPKQDEDGYLEFSKGTFEIVGVLKGKKIVADGMTFQTQLIGTYKTGDQFLVMGVNPPRIAWTTPMRSSQRVFDYLKQIQKLPPSGPERLIFFQEFFEDKESVLAFDAYDEFARAPYEDLIAMKDKMDRPRLLSYIKSPKTTVLRRRLYLTMLGVCGTDEDVKLLEEFIKSGDRKKQAGLDAMLACYLRLKGADGLPLVEETFLKDKSVDYVDVVSAVMALRFHATECDIIPQKRIVESVRMLLDRPKMADMIITDLARWKDWSVMERLVKMFKESDADSAWVRVPIITYLRACPEPKAEKYIEELKEIDAEAVERADFYLGFGDEEGDSWDDDEATEEETAQESTPTPEDDSTNNKADTKKDGKVSAEEELAKLAVEMPIDSKRVTLAQGDPINFENGASEVSVTPLPEALAPQTFEVSTSQPVPETEAMLAMSHGDGEVRAGGTTTSDVASLVKPKAAVDDDKPKVNTLRILLYPFLGSILLFGVMWSVVNGWFERLIY